jgi:hypothetical protein
MGEQLLFTRQLREVVADHLMPNGSGIFMKSKCRAGRNQVMHPTG